jgi:hypothetical protein
MLFLRHRRQQKQQLALMDGINFFPRDKKFNPCWTFPSTKFIHFLVHPSAEKEQIDA